MNKKNFFFLILISFLISVVPNKIIFPFTTKSYPFDPNDEFKFIFKNEIFTTIEVGNPPQKVELFLTTRTPFFIIKKNDSIPEYYKNESSSTYKYFDNSSIYYMNDEVLKKGIQSSEKIYLKNTFEDKDPIPISDLEFIYGTNYEKDSKRHMGILGLQFFSTSFIYSKEINMMVLLKKRGLASNYAWNLNYTSDNSGFLVIGEYPHFYDEKKYDKESMKQINVHKEGAQNIEWNLYFNEIKYGDLDLSTHKTGKFAPQYGVLLGPSYFDNLITKEFFQEYLDNQKCQRKTYDGKYDYYVCDENLDISKFKNIEFTEKDISSKKFVLTKDDLFMKKKGKLYFLVAFGHSWKWSYCWNLGKPFMKKYNFIFDEDGKQILYYEKEENDKLMGSKNFVYFIWSGIGVLIIIIGILLFVLIRSVKEKKKRLYELEDDFDYTTGEGNIEDGKRKGNNNEDKTFKFEGDEEENKFGI